MRLQGENVHEPNYGCKAVQREWEWSGRRSLMARACMRDLVAAVEVRGQNGTSTPVLAYTHPCIGLSSQG